MPLGRKDVKSKFQIDLKYRESDGRDFREELYEALCDECRQLYSLEDKRQVDRVDPLTGEVTQWDALWECAMDECGRQPDFVNPKMPLTRAIVRSFIAVGNAPQSAEELFARIRKGSPQVILKELQSPQMELEGITPVEE